MSLINKMLQDLDARGNARAGDISPDVKPVAPQAALRSKRRIAAITAGLLAVAVGVTAWVVLPLKGKTFNTPPAPQPVAQATPPTPAPEAPAAPAAAADAAPVTVAEVAPAAETPAPADEPVEEAEAAAPARRKPAADGAAAPARRAPAAAPAPSTTTWAVANARAEAERARLARRWAAEEARIAALPAAERAAAERRLRAEQDRAAVTARTDAAWVAALKRKESAAGSLPAAAEEGAAPAANASQGRSETGQQRADNSYRRALASLQDGRVNEAIAGLQQTLRVNPRHDAARQTLVGLLVENKRSDEAVLELQGALALDARQPAMAMLLARLQIERGGNGIETLLRTLPYANGNGEYHAFLAGALQRQNRHREAIDQYQNALRGAPENAVWWMGLGLSLQAEKRNAEAADAYRRARAAGTLSSELQGFVERKLQQVAR